MTNFNWQTDEDDRWEEVATLADPAPPSGRRRWLVLVAILVLAVAGVGLAYQRTQQFMGQAQADVRGDVASSYKVLVLAQTSGDRELFRTLLSGRDGAWADTMLDAPLFERTFLGLTAVAPPLLDEEAIALSADLESALVTATQRYVDEVGTAVTLAHTAQFRRGQSRWLMAPLEDAFWGETASHGTVRFSASYPARDGVMVRRLLADLDQLVEQLCQPSYGMDCTNVAMPQRAIPLQFSADPESLTALGHPLGVLPTLSEAVILLPTPTLVGLPTDEASYRAVVNGYARHLLPAWTMAQLLPAQDLLLACGSGMAQSVPQGRLMRYRMAEQRWQAEPDWESRFIQELWPLPQQEGMLVLENGRVFDSFYGPRTTRISLVLPEHNTPLVLYEAEGPPEEQSQFSVFRMPMMDAQPILVEYPRPLAANPRVDMRYYAVPAADCRAKPEEEPCVLQPLAGPWISSPDGEHGLLWAWDGRGEGDIFVTDDRGEVLANLPPLTTLPLGWLDEQTFYFGQGVENWQEGDLLLTAIYQQRVGEESPEVLIDWTHINELVGHDDGEMPWHPTAIWPIVQEGLAFIHLNPMYGSFSKLILYDWRTGALMADWGGEALLENGWPAAVVGRWLIWEGFSPGGAHSVQVLDWQTGEMAYEGVMAGHDAAVSTSLAADGEWLALLQSGYLTLVHLPTGAEQRVLYPESDVVCYGGGWWEP